MGIYVIWQRWKRNSPRNKEWLTRRKKMQQKECLQQEYTSILALHHPNTLDCRFETLDVAELPMFSAVQLG